MIDFDRPWRLEIRSLFVETEWERGDRCEQSFDRVVLDVPLRSVIGGRVDVRGLGDPERSMTVSCLY